MICKNCGFQNAPGDEFCGSCGQFLEWTGEAATSTPATDSAPTGAPGLGQAATTDAGAATAATGAAGAVGGAGTSWADPNAQTTISPTPTTGPTGSASTSVSSRTFGQPDIICWNCSRRNPPTRSFCQQCGERLVAGKAATPMATGVAAGAVVPRAAASQTSGRRLLPIAVGVVVVLLLLGGGVVFLPGLLGSQIPTPSPIFVVSIPPTSSAIAGSLVPSASPGSSETPSPGTSSLAPSAEPTSTTPSEPPTTPPTSPPTAPPTAPPTPTPSGVATGRFTCGAQASKDGSPTRWKILGTWEVQRAATYDRLVLTIQRTPTKAPNMAVVTAKIVPADEVQSRYGVPNPKRGDKALVVTLPPPIVFGGVLEDYKERPAIEGFRVTGKGSGNTYAVVGMNAASCYDVSAPQWGPGIDPPDTSFIWIDVRRP